MQDNELDQKIMEALSPSQRTTLESFLDALLEANQRINLTALRNRDEARQRHIMESLRVASLLENPETLLDVGTGGGLPGMVLSIAHPNTRVTLLEATEKKAHFLQETARKLTLSNVTVVCERAEQAASIDSPLRESFEVVTARAVAALPTLLELTLPFAQPRGLVLAVKGQRAGEELKASKRALDVLHGTLERSLRQPSATILFIRKTDRCPPEYPRRSGEPKRNPL